MYKKYVSTFDLDDFFLFTERKVFFLFTSKTP